MEIIPANKNAGKKEESKEKAIVEAVTKEEIAKEANKNHFHVLVVDDDRTQRKIAELLLRKSSHRVTSVDSGFKALEYLGVADNPDHNASAPNPSSHTPQLEGMKVNLIITDYSMPGMNGYQLLICLKNSAWKDIPVIIMSSEDVESRISECLKEGAERFLIKPLKPSDIRDLQPLLLKSLGHNHFSCTETNDNNDAVSHSDMSDNSSISAREVLSMESCANQSIKLEELIGL